MVIVRATRKILKRLPVTPTVAGESDTALGDGYVNRLVIDRRPLLLIVSSACWPMLVTLATLLLCSACQDGPPGDADIGEFIAPSDLWLVPGKINVRLETATEREYAHFSFAVRDSAVAATSTSATFQVGGEPGKPETADVWADLAWRDAENGYAIGVDLNLVESAYLFLDVAGVRAAFRLWDYLIDGTSYIVAGTLSYDGTCPNRNWRTAEVVPDLIVKSSGPVDRIRVPVLTSRFPDGLEGVWLLAPDSTAGCDPGTHHAVVKYIPADAAADFLERVGR